MNNIFNVSDKFFAIMYADDTSLVVNGKNLNALIQLLNSALIDLCTWFKANRLSLNTTKTFYMIFDRTRIKHMSDVADSIVMDNTILAKTCIKHSFFLDCPPPPTKLPGGAHVLYGTL